MMFKNKEPFTAGQVDTILGESSALEGNLKASGFVRINGRVTGDIEINGDVIIGEVAIIRGNITATNIDLHGTVEGNINAHELLKLSPSAKLYGDMSVKSFVADEGATFQGSCKMVVDKSGTNNQKAGSLEKTKPHNNPKN